MIVTFLAVALYLAAAVLLGVSLRRAEDVPNRGWLPPAALAMLFHAEIHAAAWR